MAGISPQVTAEDQHLPGAEGAESITGSPPPPARAPAAPTTTSVAGAQDRGYNTSRREPLIYNFCSPPMSSYSTEFLPRLNRAGCKFETIYFDAWLSTPRAVSLLPKSCLQDDFSGPLHLVFDTRTKPNGIPCRFFFFFFF